MKSVGSVLMPEEHMVKKICERGRFWANSTAKLSYQMVYPDQSIMQIDFSTERWNRVRIFDLWPDPTWSL